jgi:hypothetical protein
MPVSAQPHAHPTTATAPSDSYRPLIYVLVGILAATWLTATFQRLTAGAEFMRVFMGFFFLAFGSFKALQWTEFAGVFGEYDLIARRFRLYGLAYPAIELGLAGLYLSNNLIQSANILTVVIMTIGSIGVLRAVTSKRKYRCACLGSVVNLPLSTVSLIEDLGMGGMALGMLLYSYL